MPSLAREAGNESAALGSGRKQPSDRECRSGDKAPVRAGAPFPYWRLTAAELRDAVTDTRGPVQRLVDGVHYLAVLRTAAA